MIGFLAARSSGVWDYLPLLLLGVGSLVATVLAYRVYRDLKPEPGESLTDSDELLGPLTEAFESGQMSEEEYNRIRDAAVRAGFGGAFPPFPARPKTAPGPAAPASPNEPALSPKRDPQPPGETGPGPAGTEASSEQVG